MVTLDLRERERTSQSTLREKASEPSDAVLLTLASSKIQRFLAKKKIIIRFYCQQVGNSHVRMGQIDISGGPVARILCTLCRGSGFD